MSAGQNPMPHPDENLLAAFAEQALAGTERDSVLLHLSNCARCREIVYLAQESAVLPEARPAVAVRPARGRWLRWQTATAGAWLVAIVAASALLWHSHRTSAPANEQALVHPAAPPVTNRDEYNQPAKAVPAPPPPVVKAPRNEDAQLKKSLDMPERFEDRRTQNAPVFALGNAAPAQSVIAPPPSAPEQQNAMATDQLRGMRVQGKQVAPPKTSSTELEMAPGPGVSAGPPNMLEASNKVAESNSMAGAAARKPAAVAGDGAAQTAAPAVISQFSIAKGKLRRLDPGGYRNVALPAGTTARAVAAYANVVLLLTRQRALYRSTDYGEHWSEVPAQWSGKAAGLQLSPANAASLRQQDGANGSAGAIGYGAAATNSRSTGVLQSSEAGVMAQAQRRAATNALSPPAAAFVLINSAGKQWISSDGGQTWQPE